METEVENTTGSAPGPRNVILKGWGIKIIAVVFILTVTMMGKFPAAVRFYGYGAVRELVKLHTVIGSWNMDKLTSEHFYVKFKPEDRDSATLVLATAERFYHPVTEDFGFTPRSRIPIILHSTREEINRSFGWEANESAMGVYWAGTVRVLAPEAWIEESEPGRVRDVFVSSGPMAHELTHLMVDYLTGGNYPRWFTEGVAQYEEYKLTGFEFNDSYGSLRQTLYSMKDLTIDFDDLPNQSLAYRQSFAAVRYIVHHSGEKALFDLIKELGRGSDFNKAMQDVMQIDASRFEVNCWEWALNHSF